MSSKSLRSEVTAAGKWSALSTFLTTGLQFARQIILAWLLSPTDIGLFAMAVVTVNLFNCLADGGMGNAIIYKQTKDTGVLSSIHWISVTIGLIVALTTCLLSPLIAAYFGRPELVPIIVLLSIGSLMTSWTIVVQAVMRLELRFSALCIIRATVAFVSLVVSVVSARNGQGAYAFVHGYLAGGVCSIILSGILASDYSRPRLTFQKQGLREYVRFGGYQLGERFVNYFGANADYFIIGGFLGAEVLGIYRCAYELVVMPLQRINPIVTQVVLPGFAKIKDPARLRRAYLEVTRFLASVTVPCLLGLWAIAPLFVQVVYDPRYSAAGDLLRILVLVGVFKTLCNPLGVVMVALGKPEIGFWWNIAVVIVTVPLFIYLSQFGSTAIAWGYVGLMAASFWILNGPILSRVLPVNFMDVVKQVYIPIVLSALMAAVVYLASQWALPVDAAKMSVILLVGLGVTLYVALVALFDRALLATIYSALLNRK